MKNYICVLTVLLLIPFSFLKSQNQETNTSIIIIETDIKPQHHYQKKENERHIILNKIGNKVDTIRFQKIERFYHGLAAFKENGKWGFIDTNYYVVILPEYDEVKGFEIHNYSASNVVPVPIVGFSSYDLAYIKKNNKWAIINTSGKVITSFKYDYISYFQEGFAQYINGGKKPSQPWFGDRPIDGEVGFIDFEGKEYFVGSNYEVVRNVSDGLSMVKEKGMYGKIGFIDITAKVVIPIEYDYSWDFHNGRAVFCKGDFWKGHGKWGFIDKNGNEINKRIYDFIEDDFEKGITLVNIGGHGTLIDNVIGGKWGVVSIQEDDIIIPIEYEKIKYLDRKDLIGLKINGKWGACNFKGDLILNYDYDDIKQFIEIPNNKVCPVNIDGKWGLIDMKGVIVIPTVYEDIQSNFYQELIVAKKKNKWGIIDIKNNVVVDFLYDDIRGNFYPFNYSEAKRNGKPCFLEIKK